MEYKAKETAPIALNPWGPVINAVKDQTVDIGNEAQARVLLERNVIYAGGEVRKTKDVPFVEQTASAGDETVETHPAVEEKHLSRMNKTELVNHGAGLGLELDMDMKQQEMLDAIEAA